MGIDDILLRILRIIVRVGFLRCLLNETKVSKKKNLEFIYVVVIVINFIFEQMFYSRHLEVLFFNMAVLIICVKVVYKKELLWALSMVSCAYILSEIVRAVSAIMAYPFWFIEHFNFYIIEGIAATIEIMLAIVVGRCLLRKFGSGFEGTSRKAKVGACLITTLMEGIFVQMKYQQYSAENTVLYRTFLLVIILGTIILCFWIWDKKEEQKKIRELTSYAHKTREVFPTIEKAIKSVESLGNSDEITALIEEIQAVCQSDKQEELAEAKSLKVFVPTGSVLLDKQLERYLEESAQEGFNLDVIVRTPVTCVLKEKMIDVKGLLQVIGDLYVNAKRAIKRSTKVESGRKSHIFMCFGYSRVGIYEITIFDTGAPFPEYVLKNFGKRGITTYETGTGNGLADVLKSLEIGKVSLLLKTNLAEENIFTKGISLVFDGEGKVELDG